MAVPMILKLTCVILACMVVSAPYAEGAISCGFIYGQLSQCLGYLRSGQGPTPGCCKGVSAINNAARSTPDRQAACRCLKTAAGTGVSASNAASLPGKCRVSIPYKISASVDCNKIK